MATQTIHVDGLTDALGLGFSFSNYFEDNAATITDEASTSSYGQPVLVKDGNAYGPADLPGVTLMLGNTEASGAQFIESARAAGWTVKVVDVAGM